jgi:hypothetical protein
LWPSNARRAVAGLLLAIALGVGPAVPALRAAATSQPAVSATRQALPPDEAQEKALLKVVGKDFRISQTPHFVVAYNTSSGLAESLSARLELTYDSVSRFCERSGFPVKPLERRLEVVFFNTQADYLAYARPFGFNSNGTYGFYLDRTNRSAFFNVYNDPELRKIQESIRSAQENVSQMEETVKSIRGAAYVEVTYGDGRRARLNKSQAKNEVESLRKQIKSLDAQRIAYCDRINRTVVQHEVAHQVLYNNGVHPRGVASPKWLVEGLACMFETPPGASGSGLSAINQSRLKDFREAVAGKSERKILNSQQYQEAVLEGRITPMKDLVSRSELFEDRGEQGAVHYAAAWGLLHYLHRTQNKPLSNYLQEVAARKPGPPPKPAEELRLFEKHFGALDQAFSSRVGNYILSIPYRPLPGDS